MILEWIFPAFCIHCQEKTSHYRELLCGGCKTLLTFLDPQERCRTCFASLEGRGCPICAHKTSAVKKRAAAFDYMGPMATLVHQLKFAKRFPLAKDFAAFLVVQLDRLNWPLPDLLIPVPQSFTRKLIRGFNQSELIAQEMSCLLQRPCLNLLKRRSGDFSQMGQDRAQREALEASAFSWKKFHDLSDKTLLLIDDVMTSGTTLNHCATLLDEASPAAIYALTVCMT